MFECEVAALSGNESACHVSGFQAEGAAACHRVDKRNPRKTFCVILSGVRSTKSKDLKCFEEHGCGDGLLQGSVVDKTLVAPLVEFFAGQVQAYGAAVVEKGDIEVLLRGVAGCPRRGGRERRSANQGETSPIDYIVKSFCHRIAVVEPGMLAGDMHQEAVRCDRGQV